MYQTKSTSASVAATVDSGIARIQMTRLQVMEIKLTEAIELSPLGPVKTALIEASAKIPAAKIEKVAQVQSMRLLMLNDNLQKSLDSNPTPVVASLVREVVSELHAFGQAFERSLKPY